MANYKFKDGIRFVRANRSRRWLPVMDYPAVECIDDPPAERKIEQAWLECRSPLGYCAYRDVHDKTALPYLVILGALKAMHKRNPYVITFNIDRNGNNVYFKLNIIKEIRNL